MKVKNEQKQTDELVSLAASRAVVCSCTVTPTVTVRSDRHVEHPCFRGTLLRGVSLRSLR